MSSSPSPPSTPPRDLIPILHASHQVVLYNPTSHALSIRERALSELKPKPRPFFCPYCERAYDNEVKEESVRCSNEHSESRESRAHNYFQLLAVSNESSRPATPFSSTPPTETSGIASNTMAEGYFSAFFKEEHRLGMGANGSVFLCRHVLDGNFLGRFAVKKIAVGESHGYLLNALREVRLLETLQHPNIITYHHAWLETTRFSSFGPAVPTLFVLMQWAEGGSLDDFIRARLGVVSEHSLNGQADDNEPQSRSARIRAFRSAQSRQGHDRAQHQERKKAERGRAVHLLSAEEVKSIFNDVVSGLGFLHAKAILHLDLKPGNVLLTWDDGRLTPRAMLSDFGTYQDMVRPQRARTGVTGTLEYTAPESLSAANQPSSKADMWSLGMILHMLVFFRLPYDHVEDSDISKLEEEVQHYSGFKASSEVTAACKRRGLPRAAMILLQELLTVIPRTRPSCEQILSVLKEGKLDPLKRDSSPEDRVSLVFIPRPHRDSIPPLVTRSPSDGEASPTPTNSSLSETSLLLPLPALPPTAAPQDVLRVAWGSVVQWLSTSHFCRAIKSAFLVIKVISLTNVCGQASPRPTVMCLVLFLAIIDTWTDGVVVSICLAVVHLGIISLGKDRCCVYSM
ncbi:kinase-like domain-containing protein [Gautieria morchelliformis]|nr:kinase-like domain-containing protein [Gautieria morchelliformis]